MTTATLRISTPLPATRETAKAQVKKNWLARAYNLLIEARMRAAMLELERHRHLLPPEHFRDLG